MAKLCHVAASSGRVSHFLFFAYYCGFTLTRVFDELGTSFQLRFRSRFVRVPFAFRSRLVRVSFGGSFG